jgi:hypothetical protein
VWHVPRATFGVRSRFLDSPQAAALIQNPPIVKTRPEGSASGRLSCVSTGKSVRPQCLHNPAHIYMRSHTSSVRFSFVKPVSCCCTRTCHAPVDEKRLYFVRKNSLLTEFSYDGALAFTGGGKVGSKGRKQDYSWCRFSGCLLTRLVMEA